MREVDDKEMRERERTFWRDGGLDSVDFQMLLQENEAQLKKWGHQTLELGEWFLILEEEFVEVREAIEGEGLAEVRAEAIQLATVALKIAAMLTGR